MEMLGKKRSIYGLIRSTQPDLNDIIFDSLNMNSNGSIHMNTDWIERDRTNWFDALVDKFPVL